MATFELGRFQACKCRLRSTSRLDFSLIARKVLDSIGATKSLVSEKRLSHREPEPRRNVGFPPFFVPGVGSVQVFGAAGQCAIRLWVKPDQLANQASRRLT